jgi:hypothetical protein
MRSSYGSAGSIKSKPPPLLLKGLPFEPLLVLLQLPFPFAFGESRVGRWGGQEDWESAWSWMVLVLSQSSI